MIQSLGKVGHAMVALASRLPVRASHSLLLVLTFHPCRAQEKWSYPIFPYSLCLSAPKLVPFTPSASHPFLLLS